MKLPQVIPLLLCVIVPQARSSEVGASSMKDAATHDQLVLTYRQAAQDDPMRKLKAAKGADPSLVNQPKDLISESDILCFGGTATLVPKKAVLHIPKNLADRLKFLPGSKIQSWSDFYAQNRGWITTVEVSRAQAEGNNALAQAISERVPKSANLVVATYQGGPISVLPLKIKSSEKSPAKSPEIPPEKSPGKQPDGSTPTENHPL